jgi:glyoxylase I family protein
MIGSNARPDSATPPPLPGLRRLDHIGLTVPDLAQAHRFLVDVLGCEYMYRLGPFGPSPETAARLGVAPDTVMRELHFFRLGGQAILEVFSYEADGAATVPPLNSDVGGHHLAFYVDDLDEAIAALGAHGIEVMGAPTSSSGPSEGQRWVYFKAPWGLQLELVSYPGGKAFDRNPHQFS